MASRAAEALSYLEIAHFLPSLEVGMLLCGGALDAAQPLAHSGGVRYMYSCFDMEEFVGYL